jgi:hypothetical protein
LRRTQPPHTTSGTVMLAVAGFPVQGGRNQPAPSIDAHGEHSPPRRPAPSEGRSSLSWPLAPSELSGGGRASGGVRERPNRHDWKSCVGKLTVGSNPTASATWALTRLLPRHLVHSVTHFPGCR